MKSNDLILGLPLTQLIRHAMVCLCKAKEPYNLYEGFGRIDVDNIQEIKLQDIKQGVESYKRLVTSIRYWIRFGLIFLDLEKKHEYVF